MALTDKLTALGDAVRQKAGLTEKMTLNQMTEAINNLEINPAPNVEEITINQNGIYTPNQGVDGFNKITVDVKVSLGDMPEDLLHLTGYQSDRFYMGRWDSFIQQYGNQMTTENLISGRNMFYESNVTHIPFSINFKEENHNYPYLEGDALEGLFRYTRNLMELPEINIPTLPSHGFGNQSNHCFYHCERLRYINLNFENIDWDTNWSHYYEGAMGAWGYECYSLRKIPTIIWNKCQTKAEISTNRKDSPYHYTAYYAYNLDDLCELPVVGTYDRDVFVYTANSCYRLKDFTFQTQNDGTVYTANWTNQVIDLSNCGYEMLYYSSDRRDQHLYNSGITIDKCIHNDETYQALKNDPDNYVAGYTSENPHYYSRYNKASAIRTINSLPDVSGSGGTNTIKFKGEAGLRTDGGAINTMTEEEIAVAVAKGWTVSFVE